VVTDPCFYDKLTDHEEAEVEIFEKVKELMDAEDFALPPLDVAVEKLRENSQCLSGKSALANCFFTTLTHIPSNGIK
jgi:hypothetical protein